MCLSQGWIGSYHRRIEESECGSGGRDHQACDTTHSTKCHPRTPRALLQRRQRVSARALCWLVLQQPLASSPSYSYQSLDLSFSCFFPPRRTAKTAIYVINWSVCVCVCVCVCLLVCRRPGILVLVNDCDWELCGKLDAKLDEGDTVVFISTLHGG